MRLVIATPLYPPEIGGPATYVTLLEAGLPKKGIEVEVVKFGDVRLLPKLIRHYACYRRVLKAAKNADVILALDPVSVGLPVMWAAKKSRKPFVVKIVGDYAWEQGQQRFGITANLDEFVKEKNLPFLVRLLQKIQTRVAADATRVIVPSQYLKNIVATWGTPTEKIEVIYNAISLPTDLPASSAPANEFRIVSTGRRVPWKGFEAIERLAAREPGWQVTIASTLSRREVLALVRDASVFVLNSTYEGLSHALIEAMMLGTPVVATAVGGNPELIEDGKTGLLIPPQDDEALYQAIKEIEADPALARTRAVAAQQFATRFTTEEMLARTSDVLTHLDIGRPDI